MIDAEGLRDAKILVVDDQEANVGLLSRILERAGYRNLRGIADSRCVLREYLEYQPDLILLDLLMPNLDGFGVMQQLAPAIPRGAYFPILVLTADITVEAKRKALSMGARDFITKPFEITEVLLRIGNLLETRVLHLRLARQNSDLEAKVRERTRELEDAQFEVIERLAQAAEYRDDNTGEHTRRVGRLASRLAEAMGLPAAQVELIRLAAPLHDLGKIGVPDGILLKPAELEPYEFEIMKTHTLIGAKILSGSRFPILQLAEQIALTHHEHWDGHGYSPGLSGNMIPLEGRIVAVADTFDALTHHRPYKKAWDPEDAIAEITRMRGRQFDPSVVDALLMIHQDTDLLTFEPRSEAVPTGAV